MDGSGGVGGFAAPPMASQDPAGEGEEPEKNEDGEQGPGTGGEASVAAEAQESAPVDPSTLPFPVLSADHETLIKRGVINKVLKRVLPLTADANTYLLPNTHGAMCKVAEHFAMLLLFMTNDMVGKNKRRRVTDSDVLLALVDMGMERLVDPLKKCLARVHPPREKREGGQRGGGTSTKGVSMKDLVEAGYLKPGVGVLSEKYKGEEFKADLTPAGLIVHGERSFYTPSSFSIYVRLQVGTHQTSSNGWQAVRYEGQKLIVFKNKLKEESNVTVTLNLGAGEGDEGSVVEGSVGGGGDKVSDSESDDDDDDDDVMAAAAMLDSGAGNVDNDPSAGTKKRAAAEEEAGSEGDDSAAPAKKRAKTDAQVE